jgi:exopolysaccharide biosynthesis polyprenyl glycosylphosphotransferase
MATSPSWQELAHSTPAIASSAVDARRRAGHPWTESTSWIILDVVTVVLSAIVATLWATHKSPGEAASLFLNDTLFYGRSMWILLAFLCGFCISLILTSRRLQLYKPSRLTNIFHEQKLSVQACLTAGLLLTNALYLLKAEDIPRRIVLMTLVLVTLLLSVRRLLYRLSLYRQFERGVGMRNVLIVGSGIEAKALQQQIKTMRRLGYSCQGLFKLTDAPSDLATDRDSEGGTVEALFDYARKHFIDEVFLTNSFGRKLLGSLREQALLHGVNLRYMPYMCRELAGDTAIEYIGPFPTIHLHRGRTREFGLAVKRSFDIVVSLFALILLSPLLAAIAIVVKLDGDGPVFYGAERIGKKGRVFRCFKFRTMVQDADNRRAALMHMNERDGVLFKVTNDPRVTRAGRVLRKYSLDELPQLLNVLKGDMSIVGPRPPIASEVECYQLNHLRRLDVTPGITGLWQVQARRDPSFDTYISMDVAYVENWSMSLDLKIIAHTVGVVLKGTGS